MNHDELLAYGLSKPDTSLRYPFGPQPSVLFVGERMYALLGHYKEVPSISLKARPEIAWLQREQYPDAVFPGYHLNKTHWNTVILNGTVPDEELCGMLDSSYALVRAKLPKTKYPYGIYRTYEEVLRMKDRLFQTIDRYADQFKETSLFIGRNPELGHEEFLAFDKLTRLLENFGFTVERGVLDIPTAFIARYQSGKKGPVIAFLAEYDALPEIGHACGHHLICSMSIAAAVGLQSVLEETGGEIRVYGTPAEETKGAKVPMAAAGLFDDVDAALMAHPYHTYERSGRSLAMDALQFDYYGKPSHAAANPSEGINALDAVLMLFNSINALRQQLESNVRIHGIIKEGGKAANIIPDYASAQFYVRSADRPHTDLVVKKVQDCAQGAALQTGCKLTVSNYEFSYDELSTNETLSAVFSDNLTALGINAEDIESGKDHGSLDLGNVSRRCPAIHPFVKVVDEKHLLHTEEFRDLAMKDRALEGMLFGSKVLAATAYDVLTVPGLLDRIREEFNRTVALGKQLP